MSTPPIEPEAKVSGNVFDLRVLRQMIAFIRPYSVRFWAVVLFMFVLSVLTPLRPYLIQYTLDVPLAEGSTEGVLRMALLLIVLLLLQAGTQYFYLYYAGSLGQKVICDIRVRLYAHVQRLSLRFF